LDRPSVEVRTWAGEHQLTARWSWSNRTLWIPELSLAFYVPEVDHAPPDSIMAVLVGRCDYWDIVPEPQDPDRAPGTVLPYGRALIGRA
jgi:hypothetical protein